MRYHYITKDDMFNGEGLRVVLWLAGCSHHCVGCQNPFAWDLTGGQPFDADAKADIFGQLEKSYTSGITFSGGDPLHPNNRRETAQLMAEIKSRYPNKTVWLYTGDAWEDICTYPMLKYIDVLVDGEFLQSQKDTSLLWRGSSNQRVIDVQHTLLQLDANHPILYCE